MDNDELYIKLKDLFDSKVEEIKNEVREVKHHSGVILEKLEGNIKTIAEGHNTLNREIENAKVDLSQRIDTLDKNMNIVKAYVISVDSKLNEHEVILKRVK